GGGSSLADLAGVSLDRRLERGPVPVRERPRPPGAGIVRHDHRLGLRGQPTGSRPDRLGGADRRRPVAGAATGDGDAAGIEGELPAEVDRDPQDHEVDRGAEDRPHPSVAAFLEIGEVDGVVDVAVVVHVAPPDLDLDLLHAGGAYGVAGGPESHEGPGHRPGPSFGERGSTQAFGRPPRAVRPEMLRFRYGSGCRRCRSSRRSISSSATLRATADEVMIARNALRSIATREEGIVVV